LVTTPPVLRTDVDTPKRETGLAGRICRDTVDL
jgi:hypothetical protein